jgi:hypothetical protein
MARYLTLTNSKITTLGRKKRTLSPRISVGPVSFKFILITILCVLGLMFISQSNESSLKGYRIRDLEETKNRLILENERLGVEAARLKSLGAIESKDLNLLPPQKIDYLPAQGPVAVGR